MLIFELLNQRVKVEFRLLLSQLDRQLIQMSHLLLHNQIFVQHLEYGSLVCRRLHEQRIRQSKRHSWDEHKLVDVVRRDVWQVDVEHSFRHSDAQSELDSLLHLWV